MRVANSTFLITGGASGLGAATARELVASGAHVVLADLNDASGEALALELGSAARFVRTDVTSEESVSACVASLGSGLQGLINCAGIGLAQRTLGRSGRAADLSAWKRRDMR